MGVDEYAEYLAPVLGRHVQDLKGRLQAWVGGASLVRPQQSVDDDNPSARVSGCSRDYLPRPYPGRAILFKRTRGISSRFVLPDCGWGAYIANGFEVCLVPGDHFAMFVEPGVAILAGKLRSVLAEVTQQPPPSEASRSTHSLAPGRIDVAHGSNGSTNGASSSAAVGNGRVGAPAGNRDEPITHLAHSAARQAAAALRDGQLQRIHSACLEARLRSASAGGCGSERAQAADALPARGIGRGAGRINSKGPEFRSLTSSLDSAPKECWRMRLHSS